MFKPFFELRWSEILKVFSKIMFLHLYEFRNEVYFQLFYTCVENGRWDLVASVLQMYRNG